MTAPDQEPVPQGSQPIEPYDGTCPLCATPWPAGAERCAECGFYRSASPGFIVVDRRGMWMLALLVVVVYIVTLAIVAAAR